jgi:hypothetical protein
MIENEIPTIDVSDLYQKLKLDFPRIKFIILDENNNHRFAMREVFGQKHHLPIKTTICLNQNELISEKTYTEIHFDITRLFNHNYLND